MTASPSSRSPGAAAALLAAVVLLALPAAPAAQEEPRLPGAPLQLVPAQPGGTVLAPPPRGVPVPAAKPILAESLAPLDGSGIGLDAEPEGFGDDMWEGATRAFVRDLVQELPAAAPSPAMRALMRRVLVAGARPPEGEAAEPTLLAARAAKLAELGLVDELEALGEAGLHQDADAARALREAQLIAGRQEGPCAGAAAGPGGPDAWAQQLMVLCRLGEGRPEEARLGLELLRERGGGDGAVFALLEAMVDGVPPAVPEEARARLRRPDPLLLATLRAAGLPVGAGALAGEHRPARLLAIARDEVSPVAVRLEAGERAAAIGALPPSDLARLYATVPLGSTAEIEEELEAATRAKGPRARALLVQAAAHGDEPRRTELQLLAVNLARAEGMALPVVLALLDPVAPSEAAAVVALDAARAYYAVGDLDRALAWHAVASSAATTEAADRAALARLWPLAMLAGALDGRRPDDNIASGRTLGDWLEAELTVAGEAGVYSAAVTLAVFGALGGRLEPALWEQLAVDDSRDSVSLPSAGLWWRLPEAAEAGHAGITALLALIALGEGGPAGAHPALLERVLAALVDAGLGEDARRLGREAIWAVQL